MHGSQSPALSRDQVRLTYDVRANPPWQWQATKPWLDALTGELTGYLAGFPSEGAARAYGRRLGWCG